MIVAVRNTYRPEGAAAVDGAIHPGIQDVNALRRARVGKDVGVVKSTLAVLAVAVDQRPVLAAIIGAEQAAFIRLDQRPNAIGIAVGNCYADTSDDSIGQAVA